MNVQLKLMLGLVVVAFFRLLTVNHIVWFKTVRQSSQTDFRRDLPAAVMVRYGQASSVFSALDVVEIQERIVCF